MIYCWAPFLITYSYLDAYKNWHIMPHLQTRDNIQMCFLVNPFHKSQHFSLWKSPTTYPSFRPSLVVLDGNEIFNWKMAQCYYMNDPNLTLFLSHVCLTTSRSLSLSDFFQFLREAIFHALNFCLILSKKLKSSWWSVTYNFFFSRKNI